MGTMFSRTWGTWLEPEKWPVPMTEPTFDPMLGFPNGRKVRESTASWEEMEKYGLEHFERDYCANHRIRDIKCRLKYHPFTSYYCSHIRHEMAQCQFDDYMLRMKEYERERRLRLRALRKKAKEETAESAQAA